MEELEKKANEATVTFLERRGYDIIDSNYEYDESNAYIIAKQDDEVVFVKTVVVESMDFGDDATNEDRSAFEKAAIDFFKDNTEFLGKVRFDIVSLYILGENRAFIRHHINALGN